MNQTDDANSNSSGVAPTVQSGWPLTFEKLKAPPIWLSSFVCLILGMGALLLFLLTIIAVYRLTMDMVGTDTTRASEAVKSLLPISAAAIGLPLIIWRLVILSRQTITAEAKTQIDRETHYTSIFSRSVDQLGQTREIKEARENGGVVDIISKTSPNIEVRLGGIHSLSRLAEESVRDRAKIENTLLSYVRENSWSDREGTASRIPLTQRIYDTWQYQYRSENVAEKYAHALDEWRNAQKKAALALHEKTEFLPETRVDVSEAVDAIKSVRAFSTVAAPSRFYECLFVGRSFDGSFLLVSTFERCTFVRCRFDVAETKALEITQSQFIKCRIVGKAGGIALDSCYLADIWISQVAGTKIDLRSCQMFDPYFSIGHDTEIKFRACTVFTGALGSSKEATFHAERTAFVDFDFSGINFSSKSLFEDCVFPKSDFSGANLGEITRISSEALTHATAAPDTMLNTSIERPSSWPEFDADYGRESSEPDA